MKIRATGRYLLVRQDYDSIDAFEQNSIIAMPTEFISKLKGGCQTCTILSVGESAFDDEPPEVRDTYVIGRQVITSRYPGHAIDFNPQLNNDDANKVRMISCEEVHGIIALDDEDGADV